MNTEFLKEKNFEADIEQFFITAGGFNKGNQEHYNKDRAIDMNIVIDFIKKTQPKNWTRYEKLYGDKAEDHLYKIFQDNVDQDGLISVLRNGVTDQGIDLRFCYFEPATNLNPELTEKYNSNILTEVRQFAFSSRHNKTIDMVLMLNGIPVIALELKNPLTGQNTADAVEQWKTDRDPKEFIFRSNNRILAYFAVDPFEVEVATELKKEDTFFVPFNQGSNGPGRVGGKGNPVREDGGYPTAYLWEEILHRKTFLTILQKYISLQTTTDIKIIVDKHGNEKEKPTTSTRIIFPRYHQFDVVENLVKDTARIGAGKNFLIQHSAGSGKSNSIAWLTYRLEELQDQNNNSLFNTVFVVTDRRNLNTQLQQTISGFDHVKGLVETIEDKDGSDKLKRLINDDNCRIIVCTIFRFPYVYEEITKRSGKRYAIIVDEAHSSQNGKTSEAMRATLADTDEALKELAEIEEKDAKQLEKDMDKLLLDLVHQGHHNNQSFYAFTATPKPKTLQAFGEQIISKDTSSPDFVPYHVYSMKQAVEEGFIMNPLDYYSTYESTYEIVKKIEENPEYEESPTARAIRAFHDNHQYVIEQKAAIIVEKFREVTLQKMEGRAKAMVVCSSRAHAVRYYLAIKKYCEEKGYTKVNPLVAFSGTVNLDGFDYTETQMNSTPTRKISEEKLPKYFASVLYNLLVVADKYQTGFDEPLLHTMFVDKGLKGVTAVQTLSRVNRSARGKNDTYILDFANNRTDIQASFEPFFKETVLEEPFDVNYVYSYRKDIRKYNLWFDTDEDNFYELYKLVSAKKNNNIGKISSFFKPFVERYEAMPEDKRYEVRVIVRRFVKFYDYMAQIARTYDKRLLKAYYFASFIEHFLLADEHEKIDVEKLVDLNKSKISEIEFGKIHLSEEEVTVKASKPIAKPTLAQVKMDFLDNIIQKINEEASGDFTEADRVMISAIASQIAMDDHTNLSKLAKENSFSQFMGSIFPQYFDKNATGFYKDQLSAFKKLFENKDFYALIQKEIGEELYKRFKEAKGDMIFIRDTFLNKYVEKVAPEFTDLQIMPSVLRGALDKLVYVINANTISSLDGNNESLLDTLNHLVCAKDMKDKDKKEKAKDAITSFESFMKKLYYLINGQEIIGYTYSKTLKTMVPTTDTTFKDVIEAFICLRELESKSLEYPEFAKFLEYSKNLKKWRDEIHLAPVLTSADVDERIQTTLVMYAYCTLLNYQDLVSTQPTEEPAVLAAQLKEED